MTSYSGQILFCLIGLLFLFSCASAPERLEQEAQTFGFRKIRLPGIVHEHIAFENLGHSGGRRLHVYLEGDGTPWLNRTRVSSDPTSREPIMLRLMALDRSPALYLGRPCYIGLSDTAACNPRLWTNQRYSTEVVASMTEALKHYLATHNYSELVFNGHSGGGTLAILIARQFPETSGIVTLAGNLNTDEWIAFHHFSPLLGSQNPANLPPMPASVKEWHFVGRNDKNILPAFVIPRKNIGPNIEVTVIDNFDHTCCWKQIWPTVLHQLSKIKSSRHP